VLLRRRRSIRSFQIVDVRRSSADHAQMPDRSRHIFPVEIRMQKALACASVQAQRSEHAIMIPDSKPPYVSRLRPIEELVDPEMRRIRKAYDELVREIHAMTREEFVRYQIECGVYNPDGTYKPLEGEPCLGLPDPADSRA
jgi:hypothetical protein